MHLTQRSGIVPRINAGLNADGFAATFAE
jgi:hypothetical protein